MRAKPTTRAKKRRKKNPGNRPKKPPRRTKSLEPHLMPPIRHTRTIEPASVKQMKDVTIVDMGENFAGVCKLTIENPPQNPIRLRSAETIHPDGSIDTASTGVFATNVEQIDTYIPNDAPKQEWTPKFTYHGFRYVEVSGTNSKSSMGVPTHVAGSPRPGSPSHRLRTLSALSNATTPPSPASTKPRSAR